MLVSEIVDAALTAFAMFAAFIVLIAAIAAVRLAKLFRRYPAEFVNDAGLGDAFGAAGTGANRTR